MTKKHLSLALLVLLSPISSFASFRCFRKQETPKIHPAKAAEFAAIASLLKDRCDEKQKELEKALSHAKAEHPKTVIGCFNCQQIEVLRARKAGTQEALSFLTRALLCIEEHKGAEINATFTPARGSANRLGGTSVADDQA